MCLVTYIVIYKKVMKLTKVILVLVMLGNSLKTCTRNIFDENYLMNANVEEVNYNNDRNLDLSINRLRHVILVNVDGTQCGDDKNEENDVEFIDLKDKFFTKKGTVYKEKVEPTRRSGISKKTSVLLFRQEQISSRGQTGPSSGRSNVTHPENVADFERAGIPIDPMKNLNKKPDDIQTWEWDRRSNSWVIVGERKVKVGNKIMTEREWQTMILRYGKQI